MLNTNQKKVVVAVGGVVLVVLALAWIMSSRSPVPDSTPKSDQTFPDTFSFHHLKANTTLSKTVVEKFTGLLGSYTIAKKTPLELGIRTSPQLSRIFPELDSLDRRLNGRLNERVEHGTTLLTFRYPPEETNYFEYVKMWFSNHNKKPLMVAVKTDANGRFMLDNIKSKYGFGEAIELDTGMGSLTFWEKGNDFLFVITAPDRYGDDTFAITIYFANNLETLYLKEQEHLSSSPGSSETEPEPDFF